MRNENIKLTPGEKLDKGFLIVFTSWENDGDHYRNVLTNVKTKEEALVLIEIAKMFDLKQASDYPDLGNKEYDDLMELKESVIEILKEKITDEKQISVLNTYINDVWLMMDGDGFYQWLMKNILHAPIEYDYGFCREIEELELYEVQEDFVMPDPELPICKVS